MSKHIFGMILTHQGIYANNRGESEGTTMTLQKVLQNGELFTTVSAEAIRYALREGWQAKGLKTNRIIRENVGSEIQDREFSNWHQYIDDDVMGFMHARKETVARRAALEVTRAISTTPWRGEIMQNFASPGSNPGITHSNPIPYAVEVHDTRYQFGFALTPEYLGREGPEASSKLSKEDGKERLTHVLEAFLDLRRVGGNHSRYLTDYSPEAIVLRLTDDPAPRFLYCFGQDEHGSVNLIPLLRRVESGDVDAQELIVGTSLEIPELKSIGEHGASISPGVKKAVHELVGQI